MEQTLKIKLSKAAHEELMKMIKQDEVYDSVRFVYASGCCKTSKVDIILDNYKTGDIKNTIGDLQILYDGTLLDNIVELTIDHTDSRFWLKTNLPENSKPNCSKSDDKSCSGCSGNCGSH
jgi:Fe-S cluster assembly iron-binding protein IscA